MARPNYALNSYTGAATAAVLVGSGIGATDTALTVSGTNSTWSPLGSNGGFFLTVDYGTISEEKIFVPSGSWVYTNSPITFSGVTRGVDNTTAVTHISGGFITPVFTSTEASEANFLVSSLVGNGPQLTTNPLTISGGLTVSGIISAGNNNITNLAAGTISTEAVNYGQYLTLSGNIGTISGSLVTLTGDVSTISGSLSTVSGIAYSALPLTGGTMTGQLVAPDVSVSGLTGATAPSRYVGGTTSGAPAIGTFAVGDFVIDQTGKVWVCTTTGTPGTWTMVGPAPATTVTGPDAFGSAAVVGVGATFARADHNHGLSFNTMMGVRITKRVLALSANSATPAIDSDNYDVVHITGQSTAITSFTMTGTPVDGDTLRISVTGSVAIPLTFGASFESSTATLPTTTVSGVRLDMGFFWNTETNKWRCMAVA